MGTSRARELARTVDVSSVADPQNDDFAVVFVDSVKHSIRSASRAPDALQLTSQRSANSLWVIQ